MIKQVRKGFGEVGIASVQTLCRLPWQDCETACSVDRTRVAQISQVIWRALEIPCDKARSKSWEAKHCWTPRTVGDSSKSASFHLEVERWISSWPRKGQVPWGVVKFPFTNGFPYASAWRKRLRHVLVFLLLWRNWQITSILKMVNENLVIYGIACKKYLEGLHLTVGFWLVPNLWRFFACRVYLGLERRWDGKKVQGCSRIVESPQLW